MSLRQFVTHQTYLPSYSPFLFPLVQPRVFTLWPLSFVQSARSISFYYFHAFFSFFCIPFSRSLFALISVYLSRALSFHASRTLIYLFRSSYESTRTRSSLALFSPLFIFLPSVFLIPFLFLPLSLFLSFSFFRSLTYSFSLIRNTIVNVNITREDTSHF